LSGILDALLVHVQKQRPCNNVTLYLEGLFTSSFCFRIRKMDINITDFAPADLRSWFAIRTKTGQETIARQQLENQGFEVYLPLVNTRITHARKVSWQPRAFFAGYLFVCLSREQQRWTSIRSTIGVMAPVSFGHFYPPLPDVAIELLRNRHDEQGYITVCNNPAMPFQPGDQVRMRDGSLKGLEGVFVEMRGADRALVLLDWMHKKMRLETRADSLSVAG